MSEAIGWLIDFLQACVLGYLVYWLMQQEKLYNGIFINHANALRRQREMIEALECACEDIQEELVEENPEALPIGHTIIVGQSGSGKSNIAMLEIMERIDRRHKLFMIDTKRELGPMFGKWCEQVVNADGATQMLDELVVIADERQKLFAEAVATYKKPCRDIAEYRQLTGKRLETITLVVEELVFLMSVVKPEKLINLLVIGRSAGIFVLALSQYLKADILDRKGTVNFGVRVFLGKFDRITTGILFGDINKTDQTTFEQFLGAPGRALVEIAGRDIELRTFPRIKDAELEAYL